MTTFDFLPFIGRRLPKGQQHEDHKLASEITSTNEQNNRVLWSHIAPIEKSVSNINSLNCSPILILIMDFEMAATTILWFQENGKTKHVKIAMYNIKLQFYIGSSIFRCSLLFFLDGTGVIRYVETGLWPSFLCFRLKERSWCNGQVKWYSFN